MGGISQTLSDFLLIPSTSVHKNEKMPSVIWAVLRMVRMTVAVKVHLEC